MLIPQPISEHCTPSLEASIYSYVVLCPCSGTAHVRERSTVLKTGKSSTRPKTGIRLKKDSAVGMKPAKRHQKPYVSTIIPTIAHPHKTRPTPLKKNMLPCSSGTATQPLLTAKQGCRTGQRSMQRILNISEQGAVSGCPTAIPSDSSSVQKI